MHLPSGIKDAGQYFSPDYSRQDFQKKLMVDAEDYNPKKRYVSQSQPTLKKFFEMHGSRNV
jgi:hypothetical protein